MSFKLKQNFVFVLLKLILIFLSAAPALQLVTSVILLPYTKKLFFGLPLWDDELYSTPKVTTFLAV